MHPLRFTPRIIELELVDSTNRYLWRLMDERPSLPEGTVVMAHHQYAGQGQRGSTWVAEPGQNLTFSLLLRPTSLTADRLFALNKACALAVATALEAAAPGLSLEVKWPNDVLLAGRKVCGLLIENHLVGVNVETAVVGIGLNVNQSAFGGELSARATSLACELGYTLELRPLFDEVLDGLRRWVGLAVSSDPSAAAQLDTAYLARLHRYQQWAAFKAAGQRFEGMIVGVTREGRLAVQAQAPGAAGPQALRYFAFKEVSFE